MDALSNPALWFQPLTSHLSSSPKSLVREQNKRLHGTWCQDVPSSGQAFQPSCRPSARNHLSNKFDYSKFHGENAKWCISCARLFTEIALSGIIPCGTLVVPRNGCQPNTWAAAMLHLATWPTVCMIKLDDIRSTQRRVFPKIWLVILALFWRHRQMSFSRTRTLVSVPTYSHTIVKDSAYSPKL